MPAVEPPTVGAFPGAMRLAFREPRRGTDEIRGNLRVNFKAESGVTCRFGEPIVAASGAAVEWWWASWIEDGAELTMAGVTLLQFDSEGRVIDHRDYWNQEKDCREPYADW